jgi:hypothetical protein
MKTEAWEAASRPEEAARRLEVRARAVPVQAARLLVEGVWEVAHLAVFYLARRTKSAC